MGTSGELRVASGEATRPPTSLQKRKAAGGWTGNRVRITNDKIQMPNECQNQNTKYGAWNFLSFVI